MKRLSILACALLAVTPCLAAWPAEEPAGAASRPSPGTAAVQLPKARLTSGFALETALVKRRSVREFREEPIPLADIAQLLWAAQGVTSANGLRAAPSAGALYPLELYLVAGRVSGLAPGIYRYQPQSHSLLPVRAGDRRRELEAAALHPIRSAPAALVFSAVFSRTTGKYGERGTRYVFMDQGHAAENVYLQAVALGLGTFVIGGFNDQMVTGVLSLPPAEQPLAIMPVGRPQRGR
jgi:SagB-type dehydrogenase family enzyme